jgi:2-polyprenyl-6-hydroxyphenyl methylase/3-demethylubiquinone-9 3-methyltransferase
MPPDKKVNNDIYRQMGHAWRDDDVGAFSSIRFTVNPVRFGYFHRVLGQERMLERGKRKVLDVGCGGGFLAEELARAEFDVTGVDPASETIETARAHAAMSKLNVEYCVGSGEQLPFPEASFDHVTCCDVLEHVDDVDDVDRVIGEIARVLKPDGLFFYDTVNRTLRSKLVVIKIMQDWSSTAIASVSNGHVWEKFIKPAELVASLKRHGLDPREMRGISPRGNPIGAWLNLRRRARGQIGFEELGRRLGLHESGELSISYMGYAVRRAG